VARSFLLKTTALLLVAFGTCPRSLNAATLPTGFTETEVASGLTNATAMAFAPDGRLFVCLQGGQLRVIKDGVLLPTPFLSVTVNSSGERGLLGIAFDPDFESNNYVYVYYTATTPAIHNRVSRFTANGDVAVAGSETVIFDLNNLSTATNHNGGAMHFGPDDKLYIAVGENATPSNSQTLTNLLGKILRINADGTIPGDNPFFNSATGNNRAIWALGLRNPFTFAFQPSGTRMFINDVGQNAFEEIDDGIAGSNYGWPDSEGPTTNPNHRGPLYFYGHGSTLFTGCAITGGAFYNPAVAQFPASYVGQYFFADFCGGWINTFDPASGNVVNFASGISSPVDIQLAADGSLYYLARGVGRVFKVQFTGNQAPTITQHPASQTVSAGQSATFSVSASGAPPLSYQWQRNTVNIPGATSTSYTIASVSASDNGAQFRCMVSNSAGSATSNPATLTVTGNAPPVATITQPAEGTLYSAGQTITYAGTGTDPEQGTLPAMAFTWQVDFHHDTHTHPFIPATSGSTGGNFVIPATGETSANVWYRIYLTVTDAQGRTNTTFRDVRPRTVTITLDAQFSGLTLTLDGQPSPAPITFLAVVGMLQQIGAPSPQTVGSFSYTFKNWSDGGAATHTITIPGANTTFTARFQKNKLR
jgi:glucose/arabinose dehydrogenase